MRQHVTYTLADSQNATGLGKIIPVDDFKMIVVAVSGDDSPNLTIKFRGTIERELANVNFATAASKTNLHAPIALYDYEDAELIEGDDGIVFTGTNRVRLYEVNVSGLTYLTTDVTARTAGDVTVKVIAFTNQ